MMHPYKMGGGGWRVEPWLILLTPSKSCTDHIHLPAPGSNFRTESTRRNEILCKFVSGDAKIWEIWIIRNIVKCRICCLLLIFWRLLFRKYRGVSVIKIVMNGNYGSNFTCIMYIFRKIRAIIRQVWNSAAVINGKMKMVTKNLSIK